jgi:hypothetical protein
MPVSRLREGPQPCPAHEDRHASLIVSRGEGGRVLVHCFAGCRTEDVLRAWGLTWQALFPDGPPRQAAPTPDVPREVREILRREERAAQRREAWATVWAVADELCRRERLVREARAMASTLGPDSERAWDLLAHAAAVERQVQAWQAALEDA